MRNRKKGTVSGGILRFPEHAVPLLQDTDRVLEPNYFVTLLLENEYIHVNFPFFPELF